MNKTGHFLGKDNQVYRIIHRVTYIKILEIRTTNLYYIYIYDLQNQFMAKYLFHDKNNWLLYIDFLINLTGITPDEI